MPAGPCPDPPATWAASPIRVGAVATMPSPSTVPASSAAGSAGRSSTRASNARLTRFAPFAVSPASLAPDDGPLTPTDSIRFRATIGGAILGRIPPSVWPGPEEAREPDPEEEETHRPSDQSRFDESQHGASDHP